MAMGFSTQTTTFKPSSFPPYLWFSRSFPRYSSSAKALNRCRACILHQASNYNSMAVGQRNSCEDTKYDSSTEWKLEVRVDARNPASYVSMLRRYPTRSNYPQRKEKQQPVSPTDSHGPANLSAARSNIYPQSPGDQWLKDAERIRKMKEECCNASNRAVQYVTEYEVSESEDCSLDQGHTHNDRANSRNGSLQGTRLEEREETNHIIEEIKSIPRNAANQESADDVSRSVAVAKNASDVACERLNQIYDKVLVVDNISIAKDIVGKLTSQYRNLVHACDTEVANIDVKQETPVDHGEIICFSIYSGSEANFGDGKSCIWVDVLNGSGRNILAIFAPFFEDPNIKIKFIDPGNKQNIQIQ